MFEFCVLSIHLDVNNNFLKFNCDSCSLGKATKLSFTPTSSNVDAPFNLVHTNLWGPSTSFFRLGYRYFILFINNYTRFTRVFFLHVKSDLVI